MLNWDISASYPFADDLFSTESTWQWECLKQQLALNTVLTGPVYIRAPFGVFYDAGLSFPVLLEVPEFCKQEGAMLFPDDYPALGSVISGKLAGFNDNNRQVRVIKHLPTVSSPT